MPGIGLTLCSRETALKVNRYWQHGEHVCRIGSGDLDIDGCGRACSEEAISSLHIHYLIKITEANDIFFKEWVETHSLPGEKQKFNRPVLVIGNKNYMPHKIKTRANSWVFSEFYYVPFESSLMKELLGIPE